MEQAKKSNRRQVIDLEVNESVTFPIIKLRTIYSLTQEIKLMYTRTFKVKSNKEEGTVTVTRIA